MTSLDTFALTVFSCFLFLLIASFSLKPSEKLKIPHSVFLVLIGIALSLFIQAFPALEFLEQFQISPELIFFIFLPTLLFESAFKMSVREVLSDAVPIGLLAIVGYIISVVIITGGSYGILHLFGCDFPFYSILLFGIIISATDPVAVLSVFKKLGVTPRLTRLFEGESLFNDGTSWAAFSIFLSFLVFHNGDISQFHPVLALFQFIVMVCGGIVFGIFMGYAFSWLIEKAKGESTIELTLTLIMAHMTFLLADLSKHLLHFGEYEFEFSAIIATVTASMILGSKGIQKFSPKVRHQMDVLWEHFAFISNSLIFVLIGMLTVRILSWEILSILFVPIFVTLGVTIFARVISIYVPLSSYNAFAPEEKKIKKKWLEILSWASLRGAIAIACLLVIPDSLHIDGWNQELGVTEKEFVMTLVLSAILFTTFVKAMSLEYFVNKMDLAKFSDIELIESLEGKILSLIKVIERLNQLEEKKYLSPQNAKKLINKYEKIKKHSIKKLAKIFSSDTSKEKIDQVLSLHGLTIEKKMIQTLLDNKEIQEKTFWILENKILRQEDRIKMEKQQIHGKQVTFEEIEENDISLRYQMARARMIIIAKVLKRLRELQCPELCIPKKPIETIIQKYEKWQSRAKEVRAFIESKYPQIAQSVEYEIFINYSKEIKQEEVEKLNKKSMMDNRVFEKLIKDEEY
jgi:CPA1 family monovalent cation:H+ antiporter